MLIFPTEFLIASWDRISTEGKNAKVSCRHAQKRLRKVFLFPAVPMGVFTYRTHCLLFSQFIFSRLSLFFAPCRISSTASFAQLSVFIFVFQFLLPVKYDWRTFFQMSLCCEMLHFSVVFTKLCTRSGQHVIVCMLSVFLACSPLIYLRLFRFLYPRALAPPA